LGYLMVKAEWSYCH